ncbi:hypothetical protein [Vibrio vulnificus]|uniref:hypothetical protein n=1 Tax=Vibrio vulnificus TaxID=672 RepID=UPI0015597B38|nr:hypothetical protein [Vibrio vulnificus]
MKQIEVVLNNSEPLNLAISASTDWPTILVGCGSVLTGLAVAYISKSNQVAQSKAKTAELRQRWLEELRENFASFISCCGIIQVRNEINDKFIYSPEGLELAKEVARLESTIKLMLDAKKEYTSNILALMEDMTDIVIAPEKGNDFHEFSDALTEQVNLALEKSWQDIRRDLEN